MAHPIANAFTIGAFFLAATGVLRLQDAFLVLLLSVVLIRAMAKP
ncbi:MAG TPA: hypothetical protein VJI71_03405 [Candidatus Norongarragalinales archaeon]|nr:hypothetical protein [Candidatus Norongarragalinales archaeon]